MSDYYDRKGQPISLERWAELFNDDTYKVVAHYRRSGWLVSTVWLGADHRFMGSGPPIIFETMIFGPLGVGQEYQERYTTESAARAGHDLAITYLHDEILGGAS